MGQMILYSQIGYFFPSLTSSLLFFLKVSGFAEWEHHGNGESIITFHGRGDCRTAKLPWWMLRSQPIGLAKGTMRWNLFALRRPIQNPKSVQCKTEDVRYRMGKSKKLQESKLCFMERLRTRTTSSAIRKVAFIVWSKCYWCWLHWLLYIFPVHGSYNCCLWCPQDTWMYIFAMDDSWWGL